MVERPSGAVTFLFTDIEGSTALWEDHRGEMRRALARHDSIIAAAVERWGGSVVKHTGDGAMAVFADPRAAAAAAVDAQRQLLHEAFGVPLTARMGIHTAPAEPTDGDYFGPGPTRAARVMGAAFGGQVLLSDATASLVHDELPAEVTLHDLGERTLRGLATPMRLWELSGDGLDARVTARADRPEAPRDAFVGRDRELARLRALVDRAMGGTPSVALVVGEAGIGKTRLADEVAQLVAASGVRVLRGQADPAAREPFGLWAGVCRAVRVDVLGDPDLPASERRWELLGVLASALADAGPVVVVLDDLHWADDLSIWVLERLMRELGRTAVACIATSRDHEPDMPALEGLRRVSEVVAVHGLDADTVGLLARSLGGAHADAAELHARTGGNPLFVREVVLDREASGLVEDVLARSLGRFDIATRDALAAAALAGPETPLAVVAAACGRRPAELLELLAAPVRAAVVDQAAPAGVRFRHALLADAARATATNPQSVLHQRLADAWQATGTLAGRASAAVHRVHGATTDGEVVASAEQAIAVATELRAQDQHGRAVNLLRVAAVATELLLGHQALRARLLATLADAEFWLGLVEDASRTSEAAALLAVETDDPWLLASSEIGAARQASPIIPDPSRLARLTRALDRLPSDDHPVRAALLGRLAVVALTDPRHRDAARRWGDEGVAMARRLADPGLVVTALLDRHLSPTGRAERDARRAVADEIVELGERLGRADMALPGYEWRFVDCFDRGDLAAARTALERMEFLAELLPSPLWRYSARSRRAVLCAAEGNRAAALELATQAARIGSAIRSELEIVGIEFGHHEMLLELFGGTDPAGLALFAKVRQWIEDAPFVFTQLQVGRGALMVGDRATVERVVNRYADAPEQVLQSIAGDALLRYLGEMIVSIGATTHVPAVYRALQQFRGRLAVGNGVQVGLPVDDALGRLALLGDDATAALGHARDAVAMARAMPSPPLLVHCLDHLADALDASGDPAAASAARHEAGDLAARVGVERPDAPRSVTAPDPGRRPSGRPAEMRRADDGSWLLRSPMGEARVPHATGVSQLARLLAAAGAEIAAVELAEVGTGAAPVGRDLGPALDERAKREYRRRLADLRTEIDEATAFHDPARADRRQAELDALMRELQRAVGLGGRDRPTGSGAERARVNVARSLRRAIAAVATRAPDLGAHLEVSVRTGRFCSYVPDPAAGLDWTVDG